MSEKAELAGRRGFTTSTRRLAEITEVGSLRRACGGRVLYS